ncbi:S-adenosylmethionine synthase [bacterium BMS3Abin02]|nr:S-adenosylmethionine synthase [bacterium BMS3Abin02]GBE21388.1 S-adenosylmethionine synthase [bacterium BMS3Bbin01]HDH25713.1 methionine adenosyltransferase [Actinomycetota bacterium]HDK45626.1 methionine adenosyltransferase [Actinomycetota bacterium]HDL48568.1 methionine adenosyltransferase [Actinomycetota bacterium]
MRTWFFTSESVTEGHPDKVADRISDAILDEVLRQDPVGRVACETLVTRGRVLVAGEIGSSARIDVDRTARGAIAASGYDDSAAEFSAQTCRIDNLIGVQSPDIAGGVDVSLEWRNGSTDPMDRLGAGDQGIMFGYAVDETPELMPAPIEYAHRLAERLAAVRKNGTLEYLGPDGKTQVTVEYEGRKPVAVHRVLISAQHKPGVSQERLKDELTEAVVRPALDGSLNTGEFELLVNPSGRFEVGGPEADTGLTGRKIIVDTYGGAARHGGGSFSGKDPTKVDRSAAYAARYAAKNVVAAGLAEECEVQLSYAIGRARPFSIRVETFGTERIDPVALDELVRERFDFRPEAIIERFGLRRPIYTATSAYGHFGREGFPWEATDVAGDLAREAG